MPVEPPLEFSRPVELAEGARDATFRTVRLTPGTVPAGRIYFCHHFTRDLVWRDEWRHHANGAIGVARAVIAARDPSVLGALFARMFGEDAVRRSATGCSLAVGLSRFDVITMDALAREFGDAAPAADGRDEYMAALTIRTRSLERAAGALAAGQIKGVRQEADRIVVPARRGVRRHAGIPFVNLGSAVAADRSRDDRADRSGRRRAAHVQLCRHPAAQRCVRARPAAARIAARRPGGDPRGEPRRVSDRLPRHHARGPGVGAGELPAAGGDGELHHRGCRCAPGAVRCAARCAAAPPMCRGSCIDDAFESLLDDGDFTAVDAEPASRRCSSTPRARPGGRRAWCCRTRAISGCWTCARRRRRRPASACWSPRRCIT